MSEKENLQKTGDIKEDTGPQKKAETIKLKTKSAKEKNAKNLQEEETTINIEEKNTKEDKNIPNSQEETSVDNTENALNEIEVSNVEDAKENNIENLQEVEVAKAQEKENTQEDKKNSSSKEKTTIDDNTTDVLNEIESSNAEDAEDENNSKRHDIEEKDYHAMSMEALVDELESLVKKEKIQVIKSHFETIKNEFNAKFNTFLEEKKDQFLAEGGNIIDFHFKSTVKTHFNSVYKDYRNKRQSYYKDLEKNLKTNLQNRLKIIEEIKGLINIEENINTTYKHFKELQKNWRDSGPIPRDKYNNVWNNYHHHVEIFYDFLHLNRDLRNLDFKHNLEQKLKIIARAEELAQDTNSNRAFRELQALHKIWKEELGPVDREQRELIWERFSAVTKSIHEKRQVFFEELDKTYEKNLDRKHEIIAEIDLITQNTSNSHNAWQKKIKTLEDLREQFFNAGKVPIKVNEVTWAKFKEAVRAFNRKKNVFYKSLKRSQYDNLQKKLALIEIAEAHKDSSDFESTTTVMKKIQNDWKKTGHVPRKDSDKVWKQFKSACNHYFDKLHEGRNAANKEEVEALDKKSKLLDNLKALELSDNVKNNLTLIKEQIQEWKTFGKVSLNKRFIERKFSKAIDVLFNKLDMSKTDVELLKYDNKLEALANANDKSLLDNEHNFLRKKMDEVKGEINQLENNLQFFSNVDDKNPLIKDVYKNIEKHKNALNLWGGKLKKIKQYYS